MQCPAKLLKAVRRNKQSCNLSLHQLRYVRLAPTPLSILARHYLAAGPQGIKQFTHLLNLLISDLNTSSVPKVNSELLDLKVSSMQRENLTAASADTQFMARGSFHELATLLVTNTIIYSTLTLSIPLYVLLLEKQANFDSIFKEYVMVSTFHPVGSTDHSLLYMATRLFLRLTYVVHSKTVIGPIHETLLAWNRGCLFQ